jgi:methyl-accepting chemotaxis protein
MCVPAILQRLLWPNDYYIEQKMKLKLNIFHKVLITLLLVTLVPLCALWYLGNAAAEKELTSNISDNLVSTMNTVATGINAWDETNLRALRQAARSDDMISMDGPRQTPLLSAVGTTYEWSYLVFTTAPDGRNIARNDGGALTNYGDRAYFKAVMGGADVARQVALGKSTGKPSLMIAAPIRNESRAVVGVLAMAMNLGDISRTVTDIKIGTTGHAILLDGENKVVAHGDASKVRTALQDFSNYPALKVAGITEQPTVYMVDDVKMIGFKRVLPQGWSVLVEQEYSEAFATLSKMQHEARLLIGGAIVLVMLVAFLLGKQLTRPINELTAIAEKLSKGQLNVDIPQTSRGDEIGSLARAIERLGISIGMAMDRLRKKSS